MIICLVALGIRVLSMLENNVLNSYIIKKIILLQQARVGMTREGE